jgi:hypothetical protein
MSTTTCAKCGNIVRLDRSSCPACGAARVASTTVQTALATAALPRREDMAIRIRSRLMWGDNPAEIRDELVKQGARISEVDELIRTETQERKKLYQALGVRNVIVGSALLFVGLILLFSADAFFSGVGPHQLPVWALVAGIALPISGILLITKGVRRMRRPGEGESTAHGNTEGH